jgi:hypothetical protein
MLQSCRPGQSRGDGVFDQASYERYPLDASPLAALF